MTDFYEFLPPALAEQIKAARDHQHMHAQDNTHAVKQLLNELNSEQLSALDIMVAHSAQSKRTASYFRGQINMLQEVKFNQCPCGEDHDEQVGGFLVENGGTPVPEEESSPWKNAEDYFSMCARFGVTPKPGDASGAVICKGCGTENPSLEDRMLRPAGVDGCGGCQHKAAHG